MLLPMRWVERGTEKYGPNDTRRLELTLLHNRIADTLVLVCTKP
jgi:hypothetical protein